MVIHIKHPCDILIKLLLSFYFLLYLKLPILTIFYHFQLSYQLFGIKWFLYYLVLRVLWRTYIDLLFMIPWWTYHLIFVIFNSFDIALVALIVRFELQLAQMVLYDLPTRPWGWLLLIWIDKLKPSHVSCWTLTLQLPSLIFNLKMILLLLVLCLTLVYYVQRGSTIWANNFAYSSLKLVYIYVKVTLWNLLSYESFYLF